MKYDNIKYHLEPDNEPSNEELKEIEEHLDDYMDDQRFYIKIRLTIAKISDTLITKSALRSD